MRKTLKILVTAAALAAVLGAPASALADRADEPRALRSSSGAASQMLDLTSGDHGTSTAGIGQIGHNEIGWCPQADGTHGC